MFYILAREFHYDDKQLAEMWVPFMFMLLEGLEADYEQQKKELKM